MTATRSSALVTGASGFLGAHLVSALQKSGHPVTALVRAGSDQRRLRRLADGVTPITCDLSDVAQLSNVMASTQPQNIYHLAGDTTVRNYDGDWGTVERAIRANVTGSLNVVRAAMQSGAPVRRIIRTGGLEEYGDGPSPSHETQRESPTSPYSASQVSVTHWFQMIQHQTEIMLTTLRPALIYGPEQNTTFLIPSLIRDFLGGKRFSMTDGLQKRDLLYVDDAIRAFIIAGEHEDIGGDVINISSGLATPMVDVAKDIADFLSAQHLLDVGAKPARPMDLAEVSGQNDLAATKLGWAPETTLADGLQKTIEWHKKEIVRSTDKSAGTEQ